MALSFSQVFQEVDNRNFLNQLQIMAANLYADSTY